MNEKKPRTSTKYSQAEFPFAGRRRKLFRGHKPVDLGRLPVAVLGLSTRAVRWLETQKVSSLDTLVKLMAGHELAKKCLDQGLRKEITQSLKPFWDGGRYRSLVAISLLSCGVDTILGDKKGCAVPVTELELSATLHTWLKVKNISTVRDLILQDEEVLRDSRKLGNLLVDEIIVELVKFLCRHTSRR